MNDYTEEFNAMLKRLFIGCDEFSVNIAEVSGFNNPYELLRKIMLEIGELSVKRGNRITSYTDTKHLDTYGLSSLAGDIATITCGYAYTINDTKLAKSLNYTSDGILKHREEDIPKIARIIDDIAIVICILTSLTHILWVFCIKHIKTYTYRYNSNESY